MCYGRGGTVPTVTDAELMLGYLDPDNFAGGRMRIDRAAAHAAIAKLGASIGMGAVECAAGICRIVELNMADIIRKVTVEKGFDPREFVLFAFGGAGPAHAAVFAAAHNALLLRFGHLVADFLHMSFAMQQDAVSKSGVDFSKDAEEHRRVYDAINRGEPDAAAVAMLKVILDGKRALGEAMEALSR